ncbi:type IV pilus biogenesis/stability protein PilW [Teredinibacter turnerae T7901]|uniref:Type IV pilus biogenesis/stability protein PilW n=1 Tax=Teredinibacter turnerae (strain ATCC 39867 / T7901) TaxID=377629 RepID=C5BLW1_TERTT|nr:type IV pilus biogenesis/stability protein PilW [Teredinibacter turnerae]ACR12073.1 type IV pilus biogenesis/stability protein PilW [Teredinibacter turnerae T7901]
MPGNSLFVSRVSQPVLTLVKRVTYVVLILCLGGCVTTMENPERRVNKQQAVEANVKLGMSYLQQNNREGAQRSFTKALEMDPKSAEGYLGLAMIHQLNGEAEEADKKFNKALRSRVDFSLASIQFSYARFLVEQKRYEEAYTYFEAASSDFNYPRRTDALVNVGRMALLLGNKERAEGAFAHALNLDPRQAEAALELADMAFASRDYTKAARFLAQFDSSARQNPRSLWLGIRLERIFGNKDKEASYVLALKNLYPYSKEYLEYKRLMGQ